MRIITILSFLFVSSVANAIPVTWTFGGVLFDDGGSVDAIFDFDSDKTGIDAYSNLSIVTTAGSKLSGATYSTGDIVFATSSKIKVGNKVEVVFAGKLDQAPLNGIGLVTVIETRQADVRQTGSAVVTSPSIPTTPPSAVPLPGSVLLLISGLAALRLFGRKKQNSVASFA